MSQFVRVVEDESCPEMAIELPTEPDSSMLLSTIQAQFPAASGLRYKNPETLSWRGVRVADNTLHPPVDEGWGNNLFVVVQNKTVIGDTASKRKIEESPSGKEPEHKITKVDGIGDLIVLGLPWKTSEAEMKEYFEQNIGEVDMVEVKKEPLSGKSRGFGFVRFKNPDASKAALCQAHRIGGRLCEVRLPRSKDEFMPKKLFVGRLSADCTKNEIQQYFEQFGEVTDTYIPQPYRQFCFVSYASGEVAKMVQSRNHFLKSCNLNVTFAEPKNGKMGMPTAGPWGGGFGYDMYAMNPWASRQVMSQQQQQQTQQAQQQQTATTLQPQQQTQQQPQQQPYNAYSDMHTMMSMINSGMMGNKVWGSRK